MLKWTRTLKPDSAPSGGTWPTTEPSLYSPSVVSVVSLREHWQLLPKFILVASIHLSRRGALTQRSSSPQLLSAYSTQLYLCLEAED